MSLELHQMITLSKVNIRKKGPADARMLMIDIKLSAATDPGILAHFDPTLKHFLFSEHGGPRMRNLKPISWTGEMAHMDLTIAGERFIGAVLTKFKFEPLPSGRLALSLVASVHPEGRQTAILADLAGDEIEIEIRPEPCLDLQPKTADSEVAKEIKAEPTRKPAAKKGSGVPIKYRHPQNSDLTWTGRGKMPGWAKYLLDQGGQLEVCDAAAS